MPRATTLAKTGAHEEGVWAVAWLPGAHSLLTGSVDESVKLWSAADDKLACGHTYTGQALGVISLDVSGGHAVSSSIDSTIRVFGVDGDKSVKHIIERQPTESWGAAFGTVTESSTQLAVAGGSKGQALTYRGSEEEPGLELALDLPAPEGAGGAKKERFVLCVAFSPDKRLLAAGAMDGTVAVWDLGSGGQLLHMAGLKGHHKPVRKLAFTPDSKLLLTACDDMHTNLYDVHQGALVDSFSGHESWVLDVAVHPEGGVFATASSDAKVQLWELSSRSLVQTIGEHSDQVWGVAFSSDGTRLASVGDDKQLVLYSVA
ncbi:VIP3 [Scenedesmus sp. PABB004]|nr:VIP3 [Scenedesmus sp. PABB004]